MAYTARACPKYLPLFYDDVSPDMIFLVHERMQRQCTLHTSRHKYGIAVRVDLSGVPAFLIINRHGPFTIADRTSFDEWLSTLPLPTIIGGCFNNAIWHSPPLHPRTWQTQLQNSSLLDPLYCIHPLPTDPSHTWGARGVDAFLVPNLVWDVVIPTSYHIQQYPSAGDHAGVIMHTNVALPVGRHAKLGGPKHPPLGPPRHAEVPGTFHALVAQTTRRPTFRTTV